MLQKLQESLVARCSPDSPDVRSVRCFNEPVYGGTGRGRLSAVALTLAVLCAVTACQQEDAGPGRALESVAPSSDDPGSADVQAADYEHWQPSYTDVRPATADDVDDLRQRVVDVNESSYTVTVALMGVELASSPQHVRVRFAAGSPDGFDVHLDPTLAADSLFGGPFVMCLADGSCVEIGGERADSDGPHMVNNGVDTIVFTSTNIVANQRALPDLLDDLSLEEASLARLESPSGALDCVVSGGTPEEHARLEGNPVDLEADPMHRVGDPEPLSTICVDEHGLLVLLVPSLLTPLVPYGAFEQEVPDGFDDHADPQPYGTAPSVTASEATTTPDDPAQMQSVLVATDTIGAGETVADAQTTGRFEVEFIPGDQLLTGALSSTEGLAGVALHDIAVGEQITEDSFGSPTAEDLASLGVTPALHDEIRRVAARSGYGPRAGVPPDDAAMRGLAYRFAHRCDAVTSGATRWVLAAWDDSSGLGPTFEEATRLNDYLRSTWCPQVQR